MIKAILSYAKDYDYSDIHIASGSLPMLRIDGDIIAASTFRPLNTQEVQNIFDSITNLEQKEIYKKNLEVDFAIEFEGNRFRVNAFHNLAGPAISIRKISSKIKTLDELETPEVLKKLTTLRHGLILLVGPAGTGKSTTIAAMIDEINSNSARHIITIEDPVEFVHKDKKSLISQREIGVSTLSYDNALKSALREDPDVIMIGEMRDLETIRFALTAAETGHLIFATLHTNSASQTINRIIDIFPGEDKALARAMLSTSLAAIISQRLLKKKNGGRCAACEVLIVTPAIRNLIRENQIPQIDSMISLGKKEGMCLMDDSTKELAAKGIV